MASSSPSPAPSPAPHSLWFIFYKILISKDPGGQLLRIQLSVVATIAGLFLLLFLGSVRRFVRFGCFLKYLTKIIYILIPISITYIMGLMHNASTFHVLYPFWACALVYAYGGVVTMTACDLSDNDRALQFVWRTVPLFFWTVWLYLLLTNLTRGGNQPLTWISFLASYAVVLFLFSATVNTRETLNAFYRASKSKGLPHVVDPIVRYMRGGRYVPNENDEAGANLLPLTTYKYFVCRIRKPRQADAVIVTTKEIWGSVGTRFLARTDSGGRERLKDLCLSYAFFKLILRRFADFPLSESSEPRTRRFVQEGLLAADDPERDAFRVIEVELQFLFNFFYTKSQIHTLTSSSTAKGLYAAFLVFYAIYGLPLVVTSPNHKNPLANLSIRFYGHSLEVGITRIVTIIFFCLELWAFFNVWFSDRMMVRRLCKAYTIDGGSIVTRINRIWYVKDWFSRRSPFRCLFKPWQRQLGQYSFLESYTKVPNLSHFSWFGNLVKVPRAGQAGESSVELSTEVKQAIVTSLRRLLQKTPNDQPVKLFRGKATMLRHSMSVEISRACQLETDANVILVWHIATCLCARHPSLEHNSPNFLIATQLSKYCAYLVTFAPELLPGHPFTTEHLFDAAVQQAKIHDLISFINMPEGNVDNIVAINMNVVEEEAEEVVKMGKELAGRLMDEAFKEHGWSFLAEFWAELLLYLAPSDNVAIHGEYLAKGGEFITHLWALLTHAGVVARGINCPPMEN